MRCGGEGTQRRAQAQLPYDVVLSPCQVVGDIAHVAVRSLQFHLGVCLKPQKPLVEPCAGRQVKKGPHFKEEEPFVDRGSASNLLKNGLRPRAAPQRRQWDVQS